MGGDWRTFKVTEFADVIGGGTPKTKVAEYWNGSIPWLTPKDLSNHAGRYISIGERNISKKGLSNSSARILPAKTVLLTSRAPVGYLAIANNELTTNQGFRSLLVKDGFSPEFIYYLLFNNVEYLKRHASGSTFQELSGGTLKGLEFEIPEKISEQRAIAHILGSLDDKIELNRRMNQTLEATARVIFKSWFVDFDPVRAKAEGRPTGLPDDIAALFPDSFEDSELGEIPKGWKIVTFEELIDAKQGKYIPKNKMTDLPSSEYAYPVWGGNGIRGYAATFMYKQPVIVLTCRGSNCGRIDLTESPAWISNIAFACSSKYGSVNFINVYLVYSSLTDTITGSAQPQITYTSLRNKRMQFPVHEEVCDAYSDYIDRLYDMIRGNNRQSTTLASLRDTLLPKLISGELRVPDAEKFIEEAGV